MTQPPEKVPIGKHSKASVYIYMDCPPGYTNTNTNTRTNTNTNTKCAQYTNAHMHNANALSRLYMDCPPGQRWLPYKSSTVLHRTSFMGTVSKLCKGGDEENWTKFEGRNIVNWGQQVTVNQAGWSDPFWHFYWGTDEIGTYANILSSLSTQYHQVKSKYFVTWVKLKQNYPSGYVYLNI